MKLPTEVFGDVLVVHAPDQLNEDHRSNVHRFVREQQHVKVVIDLDGVEAIDSAGLSLLLDIQDDMRAANGDVKLIAGNVNRKILELTRLDQHLEVFDSVIEAVKSFA